jgi:hypothetical protein
VTFTAEQVAVTVTMLAVRFTLSHNGQRVLQGTVSSFADLSDLLEDPDHR